MTAPDMFLRICKPG